MSRLPRLSGKEVVHLFERNGWSLIRVSGSHHIMRGPDGRVAVIPVHGNETLHTGILSTLLKKQMKLSDEDISTL